MRFIVFTLFFTSCVGDNVILHDASMADTFSSDKYKTPFDVCNDVINLLMDKLNECSDDKDLIKKYKEYLEDGFECFKVKSISDENILYLRCFPSIKDMSCQRFMSGYISVFCQNQFIYKENI